MWTVVLFHCLPAIPSGWHLSLNPLHSAVASVLPFLLTPVPGLDSPHLPVTSRTKLRNHFLRRRNDGDISTSPTRRTHRPRGYAPPSTGGVYPRRSFLTSGKKEVRASAPLQSLDNGRAKNPCSRTPVFCQSRRRSVLRHANRGSTSWTRPS